MITFSRRPGWYISFSLLCLTISACSGFAKTQAPLLDLREAHLFGAKHVAFSPSGRLLASGGLLGDVQVRSIPAGERLARYKNHRSPVTALIWLDEDRLLSTQLDGSLRVRDVNSGSLLVDRHTETISSAARLVNPDRLVTGHVSGRIQLWSLPGFEVLSIAETGTEVRSLAASGNSQWIAAATGEKRVLLFDMQLSPGGVLQPASRKISKVRFSPDGQQLAGAAWFSIFLWSVADGKVEERETPHRGLVASLDYSPDGRRLVSIGRITDSNVWVTDVMDGSVQRRLAPGPLCGWQVRFSPDGRYVASSIEDGTVRLFDLGIAYRPKYASW